MGDPAGQRERARRQLEYVNQFVGPPGKLVDFGAGAGSFVRAASDQGWDAHGIEQSESARVRAREYYSVELLESIGHERYDVATLWDALEHLRDPVTTLRLIGERLTATGLIFIETGNFENWARIVQGDDWALYVFDHQFYFSPSSLKEILRRAGYRGFSLLRTERLPAPFRQGLTCPRPKLAARSWLEWATAKIKWPAHGEIDIMVAIAQRDPL